MGSFVTGYFSTPFWCQIFYCREIPHSITSFLDEHLLVSNVLALTNNATVNNLTQDLCGCMFSIFLDMQLEKKLLCHIITLCLILRDCQHFYQVTVAFYLSTSKVGEI